MPAEFIPYLGFDGQCEAAFNFYAEALDGKITALMRFCDLPPGIPAPPGDPNRIMYARLDVGDRALMGGDAPANHFSKPQGFSVSFKVDDPGEAERVFGALSEGGQVMMPLGPSFFARQFAMLVDKFGTPWMVYCPLPE